MNNPKQLVREDLGKTPDPTLVSEDIKDLATQSMTILGYKLVHQIVSQPKTLREVLRDLTISPFSRRSVDLQGGGFGVFGKIAGALAGGGLMGQIAGGAFLGAGFAEVMTVAAEKMHELGAAIMEATGPTQTLRTEFEKLTKAAGADPEKILVQLRTATRGLVSDMELYKIANNFLRQNLHVTTDQMAKLVENTVNLARSMNKSAPEAAASLERAFLNPQRGMMMLARTTGISVEVLRKSLQGLPHTIDPATRATIMFNAVLAEEEKMLKRVGVPATTLPELFTQISMAEKNFLEDVAQGIIKGGEFGDTISDLSKKLSALKPELEGVAVTIGEKIVGALIKVKLAYQDVSSLGLFKGWELLGTIISKSIYPLERVAHAFGIIGDALGKIQDIAIPERVQGDKNKDWQYMMEQQRRNMPPPTAAWAEAIKRQQVVPETEPKPIQVQHQIDDAEKRLAEERAKKKLVIFKEELQGEQDAAKRAYESGTVTLEHYTKQQVAIRHDQTIATKQEIEADRKAQVANIEAKKTIVRGGESIEVEDPELRKKKEETINEAAAIKVIEAEAAEKREIAAIRNKSYQDGLAAAAVYEESLNKLTKDVGLRQTEEARSLTQLSRSQKFLSLFC